MLYRCHKKEDKDQPDHNEEDQNKQTNKKTQIMKTTRASYVWDFLCVCAILCTPQKVEWSSYGEFDLYPIMLIWLKIAILRAANFFICL